MLEPLEVVVLILAAFRITRFIVKDSLMGFAPDSGSRISVHLDHFAYREDGTGRSWWREYLGDLLTCVWCMGFWVSLALVCAWTQVVPWELGVEGWAIAWAVAGGQGFISTRMNT